MAESIEEIKSAILVAQKSGDYLKEYDLAQTGLGTYPNDEFFQYCSVLALSRCNAKQRALDSFYSYKLHLSGNEYVRALEPRILKDLAFLSVDIAKENPFIDLDKAKFSAAAITYHRAFTNSGGHYSAVNAATLYLFSGNCDQVHDLANSAIEISRKDTGPRYFVLATQAEAYLLLNKLEEARSVIAEAAKHNKNNLQTRARTHFQLKLICLYLNMDPEILDPLLPETITHYCGHRFGHHRPLSGADEEQLFRQIEDVVTGKHCAVAYGSLAAGADIMFAEAILEQGGELNVWIPFALETFLEISVRPAGEGWVQRFYNCLTRANTISYSSESDFMGEDSLFKFCSDVAMGMAIMRANALNARLVQIAIWDQVMFDLDSITYSSIAKWRQLGHHSEIILCPAKKIPQPAIRNSQVKHPSDRREPHAILFSDIRGFSQLSDRGIIWYFKELQPTLARIVEQHRLEIQHLDTWGDAIFLVTETASTAAKIAAAFNNAITEIDQTSLNLDRPLLMRIGLHYGHVYKFYDHLAQCITYSGNDVTRTARIEPVTPPGEIFGTEPFVAMLELEGEGWARFEYAGTIPSAKNYGAFRMFHIKPKGERPMLLCSLNKP